MKKERRSPRLSMTFPVLVELGGVVKRYMAADISDQGMLIISPEPLQLTTELRITFNLPYTDVELSAMGEVLHIRWIKDSGYEEGGYFRIGLRFHDFDVGELHPPLRCLPC